MTKKEKQLKANTTLTRAERARRRLLRSALRTGDNLLIQYDNSLAGYDEDDVQEMRDEHGINIITKPSDISLLKRITGAFINPFTVVLFVLAVIAFFTEDYAAVIIVISMVLISGFLRFFQELRSDGAAKRLSEMVETTASAARKFKDKDSGETTSEKREIPMDEIVVGDVVHLAAGDMVPADVRIIQA
ncbi:MAG: cation-transporting P-type ATPase, partial [Treponema sp.]|nr:cation-transporting P-type ATPase [Treponema sp.]